MRPVVDFVVSPVIFFRSLAKEEIGVSRAVVPFLLYAVFPVAASVTTGLRYIQNDMFFGVQVALVLFVSLVGVFLPNGLLIGAVLSINVMAFGPDGRRVLKLCGVAYWSQVPWSILSSAILVSLEAPDLSGASSVTSMERSMVQFVSSPVVSTLRLVGVYFGLWLVALHCCILRTVSGASMWSAWIVGVVLGTVFVVVPWVFF